MKVTVIGTRLRIDRIRPVRCRAPVSVSFERRTPARRPTCRDPLLDSHKIKLPRPLPACTSDLARCGQEFEPPITSRVLRHLLVVAGDRG